MIDPTNSKQTFSPQDLDLILSQHQTDKIEAFSNYLNQLEWNSETLQLGRTLAAYSDQRGWRTQAEEQYQALLTRAKDSGDTQGQILLYLDLAKLAHRWHDQTLFEARLEAVVSHLKNSETSSPITARFLYLKALLVANQFKLDEAFTLAKEALQIYQQKKDHEGIATVLDELCYLAVLADKFEEALAYTSPLIEAGLDKYSLKLQSSILADHGYVLRRVAGDEQALPFYEQHLEVALSRRDPLDTAQALSSLGFLHEKSGRLDEAEQLYLQGLQGLEEVGAMSEAGSLFNNLGNLYTRQERYTESLADYTQAFALAAAQADLPRQAITASNIAEIYSRQNDIAPVAEWGYKSYQLFQLCLKEEKALQQLKRLAAYFTALPELTQTQLITELTKAGEKALPLLLDMVRKAEEQLKKHQASSKMIDRLSRTARREGIPASTRLKSITSDNTQRDAATQKFMERLYRNLFIIEQVTEVLVELAPDNLAGLIAALEDKSETVREVAATALGRNGNQQAVLPLIQALSLEDRNPLCQVYIEVLADLGDEQAAEEIVRTITRRKIYELNYVARALKKLVGGAFESLIKALNHPDPQVRSNIAFVLGHLGDSRAIKPLAALLNDQEKTSPEKVYQRAFWALGYLKDPTALPYLTPFLMDADKEVREKAVDAIGQIGTPQALPSLLAAFRNPVWAKDRYKLTYKLSDLEEAFTPLFNIVTDHTIPTDLRESAMEAISQIGYKRLKVQPPLVSLLALLADPLDTFRKYTARLVTIFYPSEAFEVLMPLLADQSAKVRASTAKALGTAGDQRAVPALLTLLEDASSLEDDEETVQDSAAHALGELKAGQAVLPLLTLLEKHVHHKDCSTIIIALGKLQDSKAFEPLAQLLEDKELYRDDYLDQHSVIVEALGYLGDQRAIGILAITLKAKNRDVRESAVEALGKFGNASEVGPLLQEALLDHNSFVRQKAAQQLGKLGGAEAVKPLLEALQDPEQLFVRTAAAEALGKIGDISALPGLLRFKKTVVNSWSDTQEKALETVEIAIRTIEEKANN